MGALVQLKRFFYHQYLVVVAWTNLVLEIFLFFYNKSLTGWWWVFIKESLVLKK